MTIQAKHGIKAVYVARNARKLSPLATGQIRVAKFTAITVMTRSLSMKKLNNMFLNWRRECFTSFFSFVFLLYSVQIRVSVVTG